MEHMLHVETNQDEKLQYWESYAQQELDNAQNLQKAEMARQEMHEQDLQNLEHFTEHYREEIVNYKSEAEAHTAVPSIQPYIDELALPNVHYKEGAPALPSPVLHSVHAKKKELSLIHI